MKVTAHFISESSDIVYYYTSLDALMKIVSSDSVMLSTAVSSRSERSYSKYPYFLSTTRHRAGGYHVNNRHSGVLLTLDGRKLRHKYKIAKVDYNRPMYTDETRRAQHSEAEDRFLSYDSEIPNFLSYVTAIDFFIFNGKFETKAERSTLIKVSALAKRRKIPSIVYTYRPDFISGDKKYAAPLIKFLTKVKSDVVVKKNRYLTDKKQSTKVLVELIRATSRDQLSKEARYFLDKTSPLNKIRRDGSIKLLLSSGSDVDDLLSGLVDAQKQRKYFNFVMKWMRSKKISTYEQLAAILYKKWSSL